MPRLTPEQRAEHEQALADDDVASAAEIDDGDEVELGFPEGGYFRGTYRRAKSVAKSRNFKLEPDPEPAAEPAAEPKGDGKVRAFNPATRRRSAG